MRVPTSAQPTQVDCCCSPLVVNFCKDQDGLGLLTAPLWRPLNFQKNKLVMEFHLDDTGSAAETDTLADISFYIPPTSTVHTPESEEQTPAQVRPRSHTQSCPSTVPLQT